MKRVARSSSAYDAVVRLPSVVVLLGAGASKEAGIPLTTEMTPALVAKLRGRDHQQLLRFVASGLQFQHAIEGGDPFEGVNVEELFSAVQLIADRRNLEIAPFVAAWHPMVERFDSPAPDYNLRFDLEKALRSAFGDQHNARQSSKGPNVSRLASELEKILKRVARPLHQQGDGRNFQILAREMLIALADLLSIDSPSCVEYLRPLADLAKKMPGLTIASLNYDRAIELLGSATDTTIETCIAHWSETGAVPVVDDGIRLLKLHGSIDWVMEPRLRTDKRPIGTEDVRESPGLTHPQLPALIFGQRNKLRADGPFLDLLRAFQDACRGAATLVTVGYSFRDDHVNHLIGEWLNDGATREIVVVDPRFDDNPCEFKNAIRRNLPGRFILVGEPASRGLPVALDRFMSHA